MTLIVGVASYAVKHTKPPIGALYRGIDAADVYISPKTRSIDRVKMFDTFNGPSIMNMRSASFAGLFARYLLSLSLLGLNVKADRWDDALWLGVPPEDVNPHIHQWETFVQDFTFTPSGSAPESR